MGARAGRERSHELQARQYAFEASAIPKIQARLEGYRTELEGFKENEPEILALLRQDRIDNEKLGRDPQLTVEMAYAKVVVPKFKTQKEKDHAEWLANLKKQPTSTAVTSGAPTQTKKEDATPSSDGKESNIEKAIRASIRKLPRS
jgi:hypothetical protein